MHSNYNLQFVKNRNIDTVSKLLVKAHENDVETRAWELWLAAYQVSLMSGSRESKFIEFEEYRKKLFEQNVVTNEDYSKILQKAQAAKQRHQKSMKKKR